MIISELLLYLFIDRGIRNNLIQKKIYYNIKKILYFI